LFLFDLNFIDLIRLQEHKYRIVNMQKQYIK